jgi:hypothetical protein
LPVNKNIFIQTIIDRYGVGQNLKRIRVDENAHALHLHFNARGKLEVFHFTP